MTAKLNNLPNTLHSRYCEARSNLASKKPQLRASYATKKITEALSQMPYRELKNLSRQMLKNKDDPEAS